MEFSDLKIDREVNDRPSIFPERETGKVWRWKIGLSEKSTPDSVDVGDDPPALFWRVQYNASRDDWRVSLTAALHGGTEKRLDALEVGTAFRQLVDGYAEQIRAEFPGQIDGEGEPLLGDCLVEATEVSAERMLAEILSDAVGS